MARIAFQLEIGESKDDSDSFDDGNVAIDRQIGEGFYPGAWSGPANLELVNFGVRAKAQHHARVMTGEKASAARLEYVCASGFRPSR